MSAASEMRVGQGFDVHRFSSDPARPLVLAGVHFAGERGLEGHSDADAIAHAVADALLGAAGLGDIGQHFPDDDDRWAGADSMRLLAEVVAMIARGGWEVANVHVSVICERPKLAPRRAQMESALAATIGAPASVTGNRAERLGALGREEGVACLAVALLARVDRGASGPDGGADESR